MKGFPASLWGGLLLSLVLSSTGRASNAPWTYNWTPASFDTLATSGKGGVHFIAGSGNAVGMSDIIAANLQGFSNASPGAEDMLIDAEYKLTLHLTDSFSGDSGQLLFGGMLNGTLSTGGFDVKNSFTDPQTGSMTLGGRLYSVEIGNYTPPALGGQGGIGAKVTVTGPDVPTTAHPIQRAPEPSALALSIPGAFLLALGVWWKRRHHPVPATA